MSCVFLWLLRESKQFGPNVLAMMSRKGMGLWRRQRSGLALMEGMTARAVITIYYSLGGLSSSNLILLGLIILKAWSLRSRCLQPLPLPRDDWSGNLFQVIWQLPGEQKSLCWPWALTTEPTLSPHTCLQRPLGSWHWRAELFAGSWGRRADPSGKLLLLQQPLFP